MVLKSVPTLCCIPSARKTLLLDDTYSLLNSTLGEEDSILNSHTDNFPVLAVACFEGTLPYNLFGNVCHLHLSSNMKSPLAGVIPTLVLYVYTYPWVTAAHDIIRTFNFSR